MAGKRRTALVTGGASGIGKAIGAGCATELGMNVALADINLDAAQAAAAQLQALVGHTGPLVRAFSVDVSNSASVDALIEGVRSSLGPISFLSNNAGVLRDKSLLKASEASFDATMAVNVKGVFLVAQATARSMVSDSVKNGVIVNTASVAGLMASIGQTAYCASKTAVIGMTKVMAQELGPRAGIRVNAICPGVIDTPMTKSLISNTKYARRYLASVPLRRFGTTSDVWKAVKYLIEADYITGTTMAVDGGWTASRL